MSVMHTKFYSNYGKKDASVITTGPIFVYH